MDQVYYLCKLQEAESALEKYEKILKDIIKSKEIGDKIQEHKKIKNIYETKIREIQDKKYELRKLEKENQDIEYKRKSVKDKLYSGRINEAKQLELLLNEQEEIEKEMGVIDTDILVMMEEVEKMEEEIKQIYMKMCKMGSMIKKMLMDRKIRKSDMEKRIKEKILEKEEILKKINKKNIQIYMDIKSKKRKPVAFIQSDICTGCHMDVPIMMITKLRKQEIITCTNCGRILYCKSEG
ncbi:hypothetical protein FQB35_08100 [Crassaminicella thermophila]|uniref:C4-type zinc ribbon domain-containing protein n=1 Tax=Crassaminicella thermophila TaxID=2599308 RepID=A0A5C0SH93_CRATE|nr:C4-type zinc ribbon domain-containing protein [Crassaminicella thermophila]QEK12339.1 hypothetical protein FQB35_08100 [Crassaminicella thermophila]